MKITCISASEVPSSKANSIQVMKACQALVQLGHTVQLLVPTAGQTQPAGERLSLAERPNMAGLASFYGLAASFPVEWLPANPRLRRYDFSWSAIQRARRWGAEAVYVWPPQAAVLALLCRLPVLLEMHGEPEGSFGPLLFRLFLRWPGRKRWLPITQALVDLLASRYPVARAPYRVSPNGVDLERFIDLPEPTLARQTLGLPERPTAGYTGHLYAGRGVTLLVELARRFPQVHFLWVGGHPADVEHWRGQLASENITNVTLTGFVENSRLPLYQASADVLLMPYERVITGSSGGNSAAYASPMKMFEYMACGRAIISSDLPVIGEVLNTSNAVLCPPEEAEAWVSALGGLLADDHRRQALARTALQHAQAYTWIERARKALEGFESDG
jgi:glycosyltransferase involved in cell wall biosynthesis